MEGQPEGEFRIERIVLVQAIEGGALVGGRTVGVKIYFQLPVVRPVEIEVDAVVDGVTVMVEPETYHEALTFGGKNIRLMRNYLLDTR